MSVELRQYAQKTVAIDEWHQISAIAQRLLCYLNLPAVQQAIAVANQPRASSSGVQSVFGAFAKELGFRNEAQGLFKNYQTARLRPDYYLPLENTGILLEVERGKTTMNNMDLLDFWKCHICEHAHYLFLLVPQELRQQENTTVRPTQTFKLVDRRLAPFFQVENYTNVRGLCLFGY